MYPYLRMFKEIWKYRNAPALPFDGSHVSLHRCWPQDIDPWRELNNGRTLTLYDLGRIPLIKRNGLYKALQDNGWSMAVAGASTRYRRRVKVFEQIEMVSRCIGWDGRFIYMEQSMWKNGECSSHMLLRGAITSAKGIVPPAKALEAMGLPTQSPDLPDWVKGWIDTDAERPWPPLIP